jgi:hypothetical protein
MTTTDKRLSQALERMGYCEEDFHFCSECGEYYTNRGSKATHIECTSVHCPNRWNGSGEKYQAVYMGIPFRAFIRKE